MLGISYDVDDTDVITRIMPTGEDKDGNLLYLPEEYVDSDYIDEYANPKWHHLAVKDCKENPKKTKDNPKKTKEQCYAQMREEAQKQFEAGCDLPTITLKVDFVNCAQTEEYKQYQFLQNIYLGDDVLCVTKKSGVRVSMRMTEYTFDCLTRKYTKMTLGTVEDGIEANTISPRQIPAGSIGGSKLAIGSVGIGQLQEGSVSSLQVQDAAIGNAHIQNAAIKSANIDTAAILYAHIAEAAVDQINAGSLDAVTAKIESLRAGDIVTDRLAAALAAFTVVTAGNAQFDAATIGHLVSKFFNLDGSGSFEDVYIYNLVVTFAQLAEAIVNNLALKGDDGHYYKITVSDGQLLPVLIPDSQIDVQTGMTTDGKRSLIDSALSQLDMTSGPTIKGLVGVINRIYASVVDTDTLFAREAFIAKLATTRIVGDKTITIIAEDSATAKSTADAAQSTANAAQSAAGNAQNTASFALEEALKAGKVYRGTNFPYYGVKVRDLFVNTATDEVYQAVSIDGFNGFLYDSDTGTLYYDAPADAQYWIWVDNDGVLRTEGIYISLSDDGYADNVFGWAIVRDQYIVDLANAAQETADFAMEAIDELVDVVDGKTTTFYSDVAPSDAEENDIWYDTRTHTIKRLTNNVWADITSEALYSALSAAGTAQATADGKIVTFAQTSIPTAESVGDLWIDTDDNNRLYRWNGTTWTAYRDTHLDYLIDVVDGKTTTFYGGTEPTGAVENDMWYDTTNHKIKRRLANNTWSDVTNEALYSALSAAGTAQATADGKIVTFAQTGAPTAAAVGDLWIDTDDNNKLHRWNGTSWTAYRDTHLDYLIDVVDGKTTTFYSSTEPSEAVENDIWYDTGSHKIKRKLSNNTWADITNEALKAALDSAATAQATADGKIRSFAQTTAPTGMTANDVGDLWIDTDDNNKLYRWSGTGWVPYQDTHLNYLIDEVDGKTTTYYGAQPADPSNNDIWYDTANGLIKRYANGAWTDITNSALRKALDAADDAKSTADGKIRTFAQASAPTGMTAADVGDLWIDTDDNNKLYRWSGTAWFQYQDTHLNYLVDKVDGKTTTYYGAQPASPSENDIWYDTAQGLIKRYANGTWVDITDSALRKALDAAGSAQATADGKVRTFAQGTAPTEMTADDVGDLWIDTDNNNAMYRWSGSGWISYAADAGRIWRGTTFPSSGVKEKDLFVNTATNEVYQAVSAEGFNGFYYDSNTGILSYDAQSGADYSMYIDENGMLYADGIYVSIRSDGYVDGVFGWALVRDQHILDLADAAQASADAAQDDANAAMDAASSAQESADSAARAIAETQQVIQVKTDGLYLYPGVRAQDGNIEVDTSGYHQRFTNASQRIQHSSRLYPDFATSPTVLILGNQAMFRSVDGGTGFRLATDDDYDALGV